MDLDIFVQTLVIERELDSMSKYLDHLTRFLDSELAELENSVELQASEMSNQERNDLLDAVSLERDNWENDFPNRLHSSFVVYWFSFVEHESFRLCQVLNLEVKVAIGDRLGSRPGIERARFFLEKARGYSIEKEYWDELQMIKGVRNIIVHQGQRIPSSEIQPAGKQKTVSVQDQGKERYLLIEQNVGRYINKHAIWRATGSDIVVDTNLEFCQYLVTLGESILKKIYTDLCGGSYGFGVLR